MSDKKISQLTGATTPLAGTEVLPVVQGGVTKKVTVNDLTAGKDVNGNVFTAASWMFVTPSTDTNNALYRASNASGTAYLGIDNSAGGLSGSVYGLVLRHGGNYPISLWNGATEKVNIATSGDVNVKLGNLVIGTSGKGIDFSATPGTGTSELLADYEEGTWTPVITSTSGTITTVGAVSGTYTKTGRQVTIWASVAITTNGTGAGAILFSGAPFVSANPIRFTGSGWNQNSAKMLSAYVNPAQSAGACWYYDATYPVGTGESFVFSVSYNV